MSVITLDITPQIEGHGAPPKVIRKATNNKPAKIVMLSKAVVLEKLQRR